MQKTVQTEKRSNFVEDIITCFRDHDIFSKIVSLKHNDERQIQQALFLSFQKELPCILSKRFRFSEKKANMIADQGFKWEQKITTTVSNFNFFATHHRPDAVLEVNDNLRIAIELKKGDSGQAIRAGIGQALVYATQFNFTIYLFVDMTPAKDIQSSLIAEKEKALIDSLWKNYNVKFIVLG